MQDLEITQGKEGNAGVCFFPLPLSCCCRRFLPNNSFIALKERYHSQRICGFKQILKKFTRCLQTTQLYLANALMILVGSLLTMKGLFYVIIIKIFRIWKGRYVGWVLSSIASDADADADADDGRLNTGLSHGVYGLDSHAVCNAGMKIPTISLIFSAKYP